MNTLSFMSANYVARQLDYNMTEGWMQGDSATQAFFRPIETYAARFEDMIAEIAGLGFTAVDIWLAHLHYDWATEEHIRIAAHDAGAPSPDAGEPGRLVSAARAPNSRRRAGWRRKWARRCWAATARCSSTIATGWPKPCANTALKFGYENHPEKSIQEMTDKVGAGDEDVIGFCVDTGWFGTYAVDAVAALRAVGAAPFPCPSQGRVAARARTRPAGWARASSRLPTACAHWWR